MIVYFDGRNSQDKTVLHQHIKEILSFPDYYGGNLDALYDCLCEIPQETIIVLTHGEELERNLHEYANALLKTFRDAQEVNRNITNVLE